MGMLNNLLTNHTHRWKLLSKNDSSCEYGCVWCGDYKKLKLSDEVKWKFKRERKGDWFC